MFIPSAVSSDGSTATFEIEAQQPFVHFKPCLIKNNGLHWAVGTNNLLLRQHAPELRVRVVNVVDLMTLFPPEVHPHG